MITIVTPTLNSVAFIEKNITSIASLEIPFQHIIVDGGSTDGTLEVLNKYPHLIILNQIEKLGMYHAIDLGFAIAKGKFITWVNSDDMIVKEGFETMYKTLNRFECDVVYSDAYFINLEGKRFKKIKGRRQAKFLLKNGIFPFVQPATMFTKEIYDSVGGLDFENFKIAGDLDLFYKFSKLKFSKFQKLNSISVEFLKYGESLGDKNSDLANLERDRACIPRPNVCVKLFNKIISIV
jgi:glycosyltransferase involved in cell wall biosynthesis